MVLIDVFGYIVYNTWKCVVKGEIAMQPEIWLILFVICIVLEIISMGLTTIWFAGGALVAYITSFFAGELVQIIVFLLVSIILLVTTRPFAKKFINGKAEKTNVEAMAGKIGTVIESINNISATGKVSISGENWMARTENGEIIAEGELVEVIRVEGVKVIVKKKEEQR